jgi:phosphoglycolate phosphatase-like HAD superfamily hydrolase
VPILVLWDIDHTLVNMGGLTAEIFETVFFEVTGRRLERPVQMAGRTDRAIVTEAVSLHGMEPSEPLLAALTDALAAAFASREPDVRRRGRALPGAREALSALAGRPGVIQSVLTGNMLPIAVGKLTAFGLHRFLDLEVGAFGLDDVARASLVRLARERATKKYGRAFSASTTVLVGDTPNDVVAGLRGGARVLAVATGSTDEAGLRSAGADVVLPDLADTDAVVRAILDGQASEAAGAP